MIGVISKLFGGNKSEKDVKKILPLVDEINRSPTRTQSALLEVMQERQVTAGGHTHFLPKPFILIATENSLDTEGVWRLGEASLDRFMMGDSTTAKWRIVDGAIILKIKGKSYRAHRAQQPDRTATK